MSVRRRKCDGQSVFLFLFFKSGCYQHRQILYEEAHRVEIGGKSLDLPDPIVFTIQIKGDGFLINGKLIGNDGYCFLQNNNKEPVLLVPALMKDALYRCKRMYFTKDVIRVGKDFSRDIFYEHASLTGNSAFAICRERNGYTLHYSKQEESDKNKGVYVNGIPACKNQILHAGDRILFMGLSILILHDMLLCTSFFGRLRMAETEICPMKEQRIFNISPNRQEKGIRVEELTCNERSLHRDALELELPKPRRMEQSQPLLLTIGPSATMMLPVMLMAAIGSASGQNGYYMITVAMTSASAALSVFWGMLNHYYRKYMVSKEEKKRVEEYQEYLKEMGAYLKVCAEENRTTLLQRHPHYKAFLSEKLSVIKIKHSRKWEEDEGFVRLGLGDIPFQIDIKIPGKRIQVSTDELNLQANKLVEKYRKLQKVPVGISLGYNRCIGFAGTEIFSLLLHFLLQTAAGFDWRKLKIIYCYHRENFKEARIADCLKWLPHVWSDGRKDRFLAGNVYEVGEVALAVDGILHKGEKGSRRVHYLWVITDLGLVESESLFASFQKESENLNTTICYVNSKEEQLPGNCNCLVLQDKKEILYYQKDSIIHQPLEWESCEYREAEQYMRSMAGLPDAGIGKDNIPGQVSFLELYDCDKAEDLGCLSRWHENRTDERMRVPVGLGENGKKICLDIHEKYHGPHGLVAGTTGAGKSELLQTYLLSLAVSFSPEDVCFFIIDYKGGGMGDVLADLPHCSGIISNLSERQIKRALLSIKSENLRRQRMLSKHKVSHIEEYKELYLEGLAEEPLPHLLVVVDEFAELKKEEPEFMQEIISVSQVGRSLGVHLILATQKPAGCVDDKIWSNTRFRLCLRVADKQDSMDMLHRPDAAYLTGAGKGYLQVGNDELFLLFQAGYCKAPYLPGSKKAAETAMISATGRRSSLQREKTEKQRKQLDCIKEYLQEMARGSNYQKAKELWMPELADHITLKEVVGSMKGLCLGLCDDPGHQKQYPIFYQPERDGHLGVCAGPATGKSTFLQTLLWQLCLQNSPEEIRFVLAASDAAGVNCFERMPHCMGNMKESRDAECFFYHLTRFFEQRKALLGGISFAQYQKRQSKKIPILFFVIDNYGSFRSMTQDAYEGFIEKLAGEGLNYGVYLVITALGIGGSEIPTKLFEKIKTTVALELSDHVMYGDVMRRYRLNIYPKEGGKGRGLCKVGEDILEIQVPLFCEADDYGRIESVEKQCLLLQRKMGSNYKKFPFVPYGKKYEDMSIPIAEKQGDAAQIPLGYIKDSGLPKAIPVPEKSAFVITGGFQSGKKSLLSALIYGCIKQELLVVLFDKRKEIYAAYKEVLMIDNISEWGELKQKYEGGIPMVFAVGNLSDFTTAFPFDKNMPPMIIISVPEEEFSLIGNPWYEWLLSKQNGICLGGNAGNQRILTFEDLSYEHMSRSKPPGYGLLKQGMGKATQHLYLPLKSDNAPNKEEDI